MAPQDHPYEGWLKGKTDAVLGGLEVSEFMPRDSILIAEMKRVQIVNMTLRHFIRGSTGGFPILCHRHWTGDAEELYVQRE